LQRARHLADQDKGKARAGLAELASGVGKFSRSDRHRLSRGIAGLQAAIGDHAGALATWARWAADQAGDLETQAIAFELAVRAGDEKAMTGSLERIRQIEGPDGSVGRYGQARQIIWRAGQGQKASLSEARKLLTEVATLRPDWSRVP